MSPSAYLDANILIGGSKRPEHEKLIELSKDGKLRLYYSDHGTLEVHGKVFPKYRQKNLAGLLYRKMESQMLGNPELANAVIQLNNAADKEYKDARQAEEDEQKFWVKSGMIPVSSTFTGLMTMGGLNFGLIQAVDVKKELPLLDELIMKYGISDKDAIHIMYAHSASLDYFLTWDSKLINKAAKVDWLRPRAMTPISYLEFSA